MFPLKIDLIDGKGITILNLTGKIDQETYFDLRDKVRNLMTSGKNRLVIDLTNVELVSTAGWNTIANNSEFAKQNNGEIKVCCMKKEVEEVFELMDLKDFIKMYKTREEAVAAFSKQG